jgi:dihydroxy-acid dehydratase
MADGDEVTIDVDGRSISTAVAADEWSRRAAAWTPRPALTGTSAFARYAHLVGTASRGAVVAVGETAEPA